MKQDDQTISKCLAEMTECEDAVFKRERTDKQLSKLEMFHWEANCRREIWREIREKLKKDQTRKRDLVRVMRKIETLEQLELKCEKCGRLVKETKIVSV